MKIRLGEFACSCLEERFGGEASIAAAAAVRRYAERVGSASPPLDPPGLFAELKAAPGAGTEVDLALRPELEAALVGEARRCHVSLDRIVAHAVYALLADLEAPHRDRSAAGAEESLATLRFEGDAWRSKNLPSRCQGRTTPPHGSLSRRVPDGCPDGAAGRRGGAA